MESVASTRIWPQLPAELSERIAGFLRPNVVACTLRLVNKAAALQFCGPRHTTVRLSQPVPPHAFARHWGAPDATRGLTYRQRQKLLCLTVASGSIPNLEVAMRAADCLPTSEVFQAAAAAGQPTVCEWLLQRGCPHDGAMEAAAEAGQREMCEWLRLCQGHVFSPVAVMEAAARGGHVGPMKGLLRKHPDRFRLPKDRYKRTELLANVAEGCDLATLQQLYHELLEGGGGEQQGLPRLWDWRLIAAAARSRTSGWRPKVEWLEGRGYPRTQSACEAAAACPDALERLTWLRGRGYPVSQSAVQAVAWAGNLTALQYLHAEGFELGYATLWEAARNGHLSVVAWLAEAPGVEAELGKHLFDAAARSGSLELMAWLRERGCPWSTEAFSNAAAAGNEAALEWLVERGCPMGDNGQPYLAAFRNRDSATLRCLARLGCPWGQKGRVFGQAMDCWCVGEYAVVMLRALLAAGCPVDWETAEAVVHNTWAEGHVRAELLAVLAEERARRGG